MKYLLTSLVLLAGIQAGAQHHGTSSNSSSLPEAPPPPGQNNGKPVFKFVEEMPRFDGDLVAFLQSNLVYPDSARKDTVEGKVLVQFVVHESGSIKDVTVLRSSGNTLLDDEAVRVISLMPDWIPGRQKGTPVRVYFTIPITFKLD